MNKSLLEHFSSLSDPRQSWKVIYPLNEVLLIVLCAIMAGADDFVEIEQMDDADQGLQGRPELLLHFIRKQDAGILMKYSFTQNT